MRGEHECEVRFECESCARERGVNSYCAKYHEFIIYTTLHLQDFFSNVFAILQRTIKRPFNKGLAHLVLYKKFFKRNP